jgi:hypothetical protein
LYRPDFCERVDEGLRIDIPAIGIAEPCTKYPRQMLSINFCSSMTPLCVWRAMPSISARLPYMASRFYDVIHFLVEIFHGKDHCD